MLLTENEQTETKAKFFSSAVSYLKNSKNKVRRFFIKNNESSFAVILLENLYYTLLSCKLRVIATFFLTSGLVSAILSSFVNTTAGGFLADNGTLSSIIIFAIGLILLTSNKTLEEAINSSAMISPLNIVYTQPGLTSYNRVFLNAFNAFSTAFFIGFICGLFSIIFPATSIMLFLLFVVYTIFIFNRPECGILIISFLLPFFSEFCVLLFSVIVLLALIYKYLFGKRHINLSASEIISLFAALFVLFSFLKSTKTGADIDSYISYILFFIVFVSTSNLIRSTSMYRRTVYVLICLTRAYAIFLLCYFLLTVMLQADFFQTLFLRADFEGLRLAVTENSFIYPMIAVSIPLNLSYTLSVNKKKETITGIFYLFVFFICSLFTTSYLYYLLLLLSCVAVLFFCKKRALLLILVCPFVASAMMFASQFMPNVIINRHINARLAHDFNVASIFKIDFSIFTQSTEFKTIFNNVKEFFDKLGIIGVLLLVTIFVYVITVTVKSLIKRKAYSDNVKLLTVGQITACIVFIIMCAATSYLTDIRIIFVFSVVFSLAYSSVRCYEADYIDENLVRDYLTK